MFRNTFYKNKVKTIVTTIVLFCSIGLVNAAIAQNEIEHIHSADAVLQQDIEYNTTTELTTLTITTTNNNLQFELTPNDTLLSNDHTTSDNIELLKGKIVGLSDSWARFSLFNGVLSGAYFDGTDLFLVKKVAELSTSINNSNIAGLNSVQVDDNNPTLIMNVKDIESSGSCALHDDELVDKRLRLEQSQHAFNYSDFVKDLRAMVTAVSSKKIEISLFADEEFTEQSSNSVIEMLGQLNVVDGIFSEQIGVQLVLTDAQALSSNNTLTSSDPITLIRAFRSSGLPNPGVSHLFTGKNLDGSTVGIAYVGSLCRSSSVGITQNFGTLTPIIFAHELGHNFGAPHDNQSGSACSATSSGFVMNPSVNGGGSDFSSCSIAQMQSVIDFATTSSSSCIVEVAAQVPVITSSASLNADEGIAYQYDNNNTVDVNGTGPFTFSLDISPATMSISAAGTLTWTPSASDVGVNTVQIRVSNNAGSDVQIFDIVVKEILPEQPFIDFTSSTLSSFSNQDRYGNTQIGDSKYQLTLTGNNWKTVAVDYDITANTVIALDFSSTIKGEIHGLGFANNGRLYSRTIFNLFGTQTWWGLHPVKYDGSGETRSITIPVGEFFQGKFEDLIFIMDNDVASSVSDSVFSNVIIYEKEDDITTPSLPDDAVIDFSKQSIDAYLPRVQDIIGTIELIEEGKGVKLSGNKWQKVVLDSTSITPKTVVEFEFKTDAIGEIHGLGFYEGNSLIRSQTIQVAGTQQYGLISQTYTGNGSWQTFSVPIGESVNTDIVNLIFIMDNDSGRGASSSFRNIKFIDQ